MRPQNDIVTFIVTIISHRVLKTLDQPRVTGRGVTLRSQGVNLKLDVEVLPTTFPDGFANGIHIIFFNRSAKAWASLCSGGGHEI